MKELKDYIHLYIGCQVQWIRSDGNIVNQELTLSDASWLRERKDAKLILRPLESMDDKEKKKLATILGGVAHLSDESKISQVDTLISKWYNMQTNIPANNWMKASVYLRSIGIDIDDLKDAGLAIYENEKSNV